MMMKTFAQLAAIGALTLSALSAQAMNVTNDITLVASPSSLAAGTPGNHKLSGAFTDTFTFSYSGSAIVDVSLTTLVSKASLAKQQIVFTSATLNDMALTIDPTIDFGRSLYTTAGLYQVPANGNFTLIVNGYAGLEGSVGQVISASYSGSINVTPVPEPETYALMLGGLAAIGFIARRRKSV